MTYVEASWNALTERLKSMDAKRVYITGGPDSGKTTLAHFLTQMFSIHKPTALVDTDPGQSALGLPTTVSAGFYSPGSTRPNVIFSRFVGDTSPQHKQATILTALQRLSAKMQNKGAELLIFDSSGFVIGQAATEFQAAIIELLQIDTVILLQRENELQPLEIILKKFGNVTVENVAASKAIMPRSMPVRKENRELKYRKYFDGQNIRVLDVNDLALCGSLPERFTVQSMRGRLLAFCDHEKFVLALGIARSFYESDKICICQAPDFDLNQAAFLHFGDIFINPGFKEEHLSKRIAKNKERH